jgi:hypothetical protein
MTCVQCLMVQKNGAMYLKDILTGVRICQISVPSPYQIQTPWEPIVAFGGRGQFLYVKGELFNHETIFFKTNKQIIKHAVKHIDNSKLSMCAFT